MIPRLSAKDLYLVWFLCVCQLVDKGILKNWNFGKKAWDMSSNMLGLFSRLEFFVPGILQCVYFFVHFCCCCFRWIYVHKWVAVTETYGSIVEWGNKLTAHIDASEVQSMKNNGQFRNTPRSTDQYSNMALRLSGQTSIFGSVFLVSKPIFGTDLETKES